MIYDVAVALGPLPICFRIFSFCLEFINFQLSSSTSGCSVEMAAFFVMGAYFSSSLILFLSDKGFPVSISDLVFHLVAVPYRRWLHIGTPLSGCFSAFKI